MATQGPDGYRTEWGAWFEAMEALSSTQAVPSPGGWRGPGEPPQGVVPRLDRVPWWVRVGYHYDVAMTSTPAKKDMFDRRASRWMWSHGGFDVIPPSVKLPPPPEPPPASAAAVVLPLTGERVYLDDIRQEDSAPSLEHASGHRWPVGAARITDHGRRFSNQRWASHVYGVRSTPAPVSVRFSRPSRWRFLRRSQEAEVVFGPQGLWAAETLGYWNVVKVWHAGQTHRTDLSPMRRWRLRRPRKQAGEDGVIFGPP